METPPPKGASRSDATPPGPKLHPEVLAAQSRDILSVLLFIRFINALCVRTFFQPDEFFQALEPAWSIAFGQQSGAWLTWVCSEGIIDKHSLFHAPSPLFALCLHSSRNGNTSCAHHSTQPCFQQHTSLPIKRWASYSCYRSLEHISSLPSHKWSSRCSQLSATSTRGNSPRGFTAEIVTRRGPPYVNRPQARYGAFLT